MLSRLLQPEKAPELIYFNFSERVTFFNPVQPAKEFSPKEETLEDSSAFSIEVQLLNALSPIVLSESLNVTFFTEEHSSNALLPISLKFLLKLKFSIEEQPLNAESAIVLRFSEKVTLLRLKQFSNADFPTDIILSGKVIFFKLVQFLKQLSGRTIKPFSKVTFSM